VVLLTGDIEEKIEAEIIAKFGKKLQADVLVVPHHGSNTSSSRRFIDIVDPEIAIISAGYKNRYKLPSSLVMQRYENSHRKLLQTSNSGAISVSFSENKPLRIERYREKAKKYWHHQNF
jgi:competence protein ComEC